MARVTAVKFHYGLTGTNPARGNLKTGIVLLNPFVWKNLTEAQRFYVLCHEEGHIVLQTKSEERADAYAARKFIQSGYSPRELAEILDRILPPDNATRGIRSRKLLKRSLALDYLHNGNQRAKEEFLKMRTA